MPRSPLRVSALRATAVGAGLLLHAALASAAWRAEGPFLANVVQLAVDPSDARVVYAATSGGGVWRSIDGGSTWTLPGSEMTSRDVEWVEIDPAHPATLWVGVHNEAGSGSVWRSSDRGATWAVASGKVQGESGGRGIQLIGQRVAFGKAGTIYAPASNLHYRSEDGGKTWRDFRVPNQDAYTFAVNPTDPKIVLAGGRGESLNISRSADGGRTWKQTGIGLGNESVHRLFYDAKEPRTVYAVAGTFGKVFKSTDAGDNWSELTLPVGGTSQVFDLAIAPGTHRLWAMTQEGLMFSEDGGARWHMAINGLGGYVVRALAFDAARPDHLLAGSSGAGVFATDDAGRTWHESSQGLGGGWVKGLWGSGASTLFAQLASGLFRFDGPGRWTPLQEPFADSDGDVELDGILFDRTSPQNVWAYKSSSIWRSSDGGRRWQAMEQKGPSMRDMMKGNLASAEFHALTQDPGNPKVLYSGSWSTTDGSPVWKTTDAGKKWQPAATGLPAEAVQRLLAVAPNTVLAIVDKKTVYRTTDGGAHWAESGEGLPTAAELREMVVDPKTAGRVYIATAAGLFRSNDGGATFAKVGGAVAREDVEAVTVDATSGAVYAGSFHGVWRSADGGGTWTAMSDGLSNSDVRALAIAGSPARLYAGLAGGSVVSTELQ